MNVRRCIWLTVCLSILLLSFSGSPPQTVYASSSEEIRDQLDDLEQEQQELQAQIDQLEQQRSDNLSQIQDISAQKLILDQQVSLLNQQILTIQEQIQICKQQVADKQDEFDLATAHYDALHAQYKDRIRVMEEQGSITYWSILFHARSMADFLDRINMIDEIAQADHSHLTQLQEAAAQVAEAQAELSVRQAELQASSDSLEATRLQLEEKLAQTDLLLQELIARGEEFEALLDASEAEQAELMLQISQLEDAFDKAAYEEWLAANPPAAKPPAQEQTPDTSREWVVPVPFYTLSSRFGMRLHPIYGEWRMHYGIDMGCPAGTPIYATRSGQVEIAVWSDSAGNYVQINHGDGYRSVYMHMTHYIVSPGQYVTAGQTIGYVGNTGASKGDHLHFGISLNGQYIDPYPLIASQ